MDHPTDPHSARISPPPAPGAGQSAILSGLRVLDVTEALAGPFCTMYLGDMGADVLKIERPERGDQTRGWGPPFINGEAAYFMSTNRNKRSLTLDAKTVQGKAILRRLLGTADIFVTNLPRTSSMEELGIDPATSLARNPRLIHVAISGFGHRGPRAGQPGYDILAQGMGGTMSLTGDADGEPIRFPTPIADMTAGLYALSGVLAALYDRERTGRGQSIDVGLVESQITWLTTLAGSYFATGQPPPRLGNQHPTITPYQAFATADGHIILACGTDRIWARLCRALDLPDDVRDDPRFATNPARNVNRSALVPTLSARFMTRPSSEWLERFRELDIPSGPIYLLDEALADPQVLARDLIVQLEHPIAGLVRSLAFPAHLRPGGLSYRRPPPTLGQHTDEILAELGYSPAEGQQLRRGRVV